MISVFNNCISCNSVLQKWAHKYSFMVLIPPALFQAELGTASATIMKVSQHLSQSAL